MNSPLQLHIWLRHQRKLSGMTLKQLSIKSGVSVSRLSELEHENCNLRINTFIKICKGLNCEPEIVLKETSK